MSRSESTLAFFCRVGFRGVINLALDPDLSRIFSFLVILDPDSDPVKIEIVTHLPGGAATCSEGFAYFF